jgi:hypothetical protein
MPTPTSPPAAVVVAHPFRSAVRTAVLRDLETGAVAPDARAEVEAFAALLGSTGRLPLPDSAPARQAVAQAVARAACDAAARGHWRAVVALARVVDAVVTEHGLTPPSPSS